MMAMKSRTYVFDMATLLALMASAGSTTSPPPNLVLIVADDLGWNDVPWHNPGILAPNLRRLASEGVTLEQNYVQPVCSPTRGALMTGRYPYRFGMQNGVIRPLEPQGLPLELPVLADELRRRGYSTHAIGKWHLGFCKWQYTPTFRGFDSFRGFYLGSGDYYEHLGNAELATDRHQFGPGARADWKPRGKVPRGTRGYDFRTNNRVGWEARGRYSTTVFGREATKVVRRSSRHGRPVFLYLAFQAVHAPLQVPAKYENLYRHIRNVDRRRFCGMVTAMDDAVGILEQELIRQGLWNNTVLIFTSDNGGQVLAGGNNWPLRGNKNTLWEGGTRVPGFVASPLLKRRNCISHSVVHVTDWFPTLLGLAGGTPAPVGLDGVDQWAALSECGPSAREGFVYNLFDQTPLTGAIRFGDHKLLHGSGGRPDGWYPEPLLEKANIDKTGPKTNLTLFLFNVRDDPNERHDLSAQKPELTAWLDSLLMEQAATMAPSIQTPDDPRGDPRKFDGAFSPEWC
ncbi:arylsulfatase I isoform X2 [Ixodes scapularis]